MTSCGFDSLPNQVTTRHTSHGLSFNIMVVGPTGIGKTTLIKSLFDFDYGESPDLERELTNVELRSKSIKPENKTIDMKLTIIETRGYGNQLDKSNSYKPILEYITARYEDYLKAELKVQETRYNDISDTRVHCCIYMIAPTGLKSIDLVTMKKLHQRVCLIPVIGKSDTLTKQERQALKERVRQEITLNGIEIYPIDPHLLPVAVAASNDFDIEKSGKRQRVRVYPWGKMYIERDSEFPKLRDLVLRSNMLSLVEDTNRVHYEKYRKEVTSEVHLDKEIQVLEEEYEREKALLLREIKKLEQEAPQPKLGRRSTYIFT